MQVSYAIERVPGADYNEDVILASEGVVIVLDGATVAAPADTGCQHDTAWYVRRLGAQVIDALAHEPAASLPSLLATAIARTRDDHEGRCDLEHPGTPSSTVCMLRRTGAELDYLVLCDSPLALDRAGEIEVITDLRLSRTSAAQRAAVLAGRGAVGTEQHWDTVRELQAAQRRWRNTDGGFWVAATNPDAAHHAVTGTATLTGPSAVTQALLMTDGASRAIDTFDLIDWPGAFTLVTRHGPAELIRRVRDAENADPDGTSFPRGKRHDDATVVHCKFN